MDCSLDDLEFLVGHWVSEREDENEELWMEPKAGIMLGLNRSLRKSGEATYEFLRIELRDDEIFYVASPKGQATTEFDLAELGENRAVFTNPEHDFPQRLEYTRDGDILSAQVSGLRDGKPSEFTLTWTLQK
ncbi:MAG: hypothetical protein KDC26_09560 [Armatimonadetes bacterium]|nr:hypothetical protein [Armatimonadota bacterium]